MIDKRLGCNCSDCVYFENPGDDSKTDMGECTMYTSSTDIIARRYNSCNGFCGGHSYFKYVQGKLAIADALSEPCTLVEGPR